MPSGPPTSASSRSARAPRVTTLVGEVELTRVLAQIAIEAERLVLADSINVQSSFEDDFGLIAVEDSVPAYFLYRSAVPARVTSGPRGMGTDCDAPYRLEETPTSQWVFYSYVPDHAPVRSKMLSALSPSPISSVKANPSLPGPRYASSRATLVKNLGDSRVATSIFATTAADLNHASYLSHLKHLSSAAPLTTREQEIADIRTAERSASHDAFEGAQAGQAVWSGAVGLAWSEEAKEVLEKFAVGEVEGEVVRLVSRALGGGGGRRCGEGFTEFRG